MPFSSAPPLCAATRRSRHELAEVVGGQVQGRAADEDIVVFKSLGIAAEDAAVAKIVYDRARERGLGDDL